jgi:diadenosine tetraphosphate (Ap4A) HIT family hydrolase
MPDDCPFCTLDPERIIAETRLTITIRDDFPVSSGHTLILPKRHVASFFELVPGERHEIMTALDLAEQDLDEEFKPDGYNIGINDGPCAGATVAHLHVHLIPRYQDDKDDPRGGIRWIFPEKADYWTQS